ncbi:AAA family ATPase [Helicobacter pylori]
MKFYKHVLKLHHFRNLGRKSPAELLLNSSFENKHGGLVVLVGENNVGKSNVLEALKIFNDADVKLCSEEDSLLSLEETILDHKIIGFSCMDLKIRTEEIGEELKELSKILISYPFCVFIGGFINLIMSYGVLDSFLKSYKEKLKLSTFSTKQNRNLLFKELIKHLSGNNQLVKNFCQYIREIIEYNAPNKEYKPNHFFIMGKNRQNQLAETYSRFKELSENEIKNKKDVKYISNKIKSLDEVFNTTDFNAKFTPKIEMKDIIKEIDEKYPINEKFKQQFRTFQLNIGNLKKKIKNSLKYLKKTREDFERKKERLIQEKNYCKNQKVLEFNYDVLLDNIEQICKNYIASHAVNDASKDVKYMMCQFYLEKMELLSNSKIRQYQYDDLLKSARISLWESIKILDNESGTPLFPKNIDEIKDKFEINKKKLKQSKNVSEFAEYCRECNPYTAFQNLRNKVQFPLSGGLSYKFDKLVPTMKEYKELKITDNDLKTTLFTFFDYSSPSEFNQSDWLFRNSLFRKIDFNPYDIWKNLNLDDKKDFAEILKYNMQLKIDSSIAKEFNELLAIAQDSPQNSYQLKIRVRHNNKFYDYSKKSTAYEIKLEIHDCRKSHDHNEPIILSQQSTGF